MLDRSRLMMDARKWLASELAPKKYGDKVDAQLSSPDGGPIQEHLTVEHIRRKTKRALVADYTRSIDVKAH